MVNLFSQSALPTITPIIPICFKLNSFFISSTFEIPPDAINGRDVNLENSNVKSRVNLEYSKEFASSSKVVTSYASDSESFGYQADNKNRDIYTAGLGLDFKHDQGLTISTDFERQQIKGHGYINKFTLSAGFLYRNETEFAFGLDEDMTSNFKISKALDGFHLEFNLENDFSKKENHNDNLSLSSKF